MAMLKSPATCAAFAATATSAHASCRSPEHSSTPNGDMSTTHSSYIVSLYCARTAFSRRVASSGRVAPGVASS